MKVLVITLQEEIPKVKKAKHKHEDDDDKEEEDDDEQESKTMIALFFEYLPYSAKNVIENKMISNTLKVRIAVEVTFGIHFIHSLGMIHRDLKLENIMMNGAFNAKKIDFGLAYFSDLSSSRKSLTKGIGTFAYMSPEMLNEEEYNNKTDVCSYGIILFALFTGKLPKQSLKERLDKVPIKFPTPSSKISKYCISFIKRCTSFSPNERPSFDEIINDMGKKSFDMTLNVD